MSSQILFNTSTLFANDSQPDNLADFNKHIIWFAPKGECDGDRIAVLRTPGNLRTIFGSNCDGKLIAAGIASQRADATVSLTPAA